jgi:hypothetical protein
MWRSPDALKWRCLIRIRFEAEYIDSMLHSHFCEISQR